MTPDEVLSNATQEEKARAFDLLHRYHNQEKTSTNYVYRMTHHDAAIRLTTYLKAVMLDDAMIWGPELYMDYTVWDHEEHDTVSDN